MCLLGEIIFSVFIIIIIDSMHGMEMKICISEYKMMEMMVEKM